MHRVINQGDTVIDIGAHKAAYLYFMAQLTGTTGKVYAIEPQSTLYKYVARIKEVFCWNHVTVEHLALSDTAGSAQLFVPVNKSDQTSSPGASIDTPQSGKEIIYTEREAAACRGGRAGRHCLPLWPVDAGVHSHAKGRERVGRTMRRDGQEKRSGAEGRGRDPGPRSPHPDARCDTQKHRRDLRHTPCLTPYLGILVPTRTASAARSARNGDRL